jgi:gluconolactonase
VQSPVDPIFRHEILASDLDHVEGVCWDPLRSCVWAGGEAGQIYRIGLDGSVEIVATIDGGALLGIALDGDGYLYLCDPGNHQVWRYLPGQQPEAFGDAIAYPNYAAFVPDGRLFVSDSGSITEDTGALVAIDLDGTTQELISPSLAFSNGLAYRDGQVYVVESSRPGVGVFDLTSGNYAPLIDMERCLPDGLAFDNAGGLWISCYQPNQVWRWTKEAGLELLIDDWSGEFILSPTNIAFVGEHLDRLVLASLCGHSISIISPEQAGVTLEYPTH